MTPDASARPLRSVHTADFPGLLAHLGASLLVTTYQAGKPVIVRADDRLAVGVAIEYWEYHNAHAVARRLDPPGRHDAWFLPRTAHVTGDVQIHEMACACFRDLINIDHDLLADTFVLAGEARAAAPAAFTPCDLAPCQGVSR